MAAESGPRERPGPERTGLTEVPQAIELREQDALSDRLKKFLTGRADVDSDTDDVAQLLNRHPNSGASLWLQDDLREAIETKEFTPESVYALTAIGIDDQAEVDAWSRELWTPGWSHPECARRRRGFLSQSRRGNQDNLEDGT